MAAGHREAARSVLDGGEHGARLKRAGASAEEMTMRDTSLLQLALGLVPPWAVIRSEFDAEARQLDIHIDFAAGSRFACPCCGAADCPAYDTEQMSWRHLDFFQHQAFLYARVPRVHCTRCGIKTLSVPWARPDSGFTLLFEALVMSLVSAMPVNAVARLVGEHDTRLWRVIHHYVDRARAKADLSTVRRVAIDETAARRGHNYITLFVDIDQARVVFATDGRDAETIAFFADDLTMHGGAPSAIAEVCIDMSPAFIKGIANSLPAAAITFDKFHAVKIVNDAVDQVRGPNAKSTTSWRALAISGSAIRSTCPTDSEPHSKTSRYAISRPHVHTASGWRSRNSMTNPLLTRRRSSSRSGTSGQPTAGCRQSSMPRALSSATGTASCAGSTAG
jgi:transposase